MPAQPDKTMSSKNKLDESLIFMASSPSIKDNPSLLKKQQ
jgi:hypothetical protein